MTKNQPTLINSVALVLCFFLNNWLFLGRSLRITHIKSSDEGEYACRAQNIAGFQLESASIYVRDKVCIIYTSR